jgi:hypothetical protein
MVLIKSSLKIDIDIRKRLMSKVRHVSQAVQQRRDGGHPDGMSCRRACSHAVMAAVQSNDVAKKA